MNRLTLFFLLLIGLFGSCKSNEKAYNATYQKLKEKNEENILAERAKTAVSISEEVMKRQDTGVSQMAEVVTLVLGDEKNLSVYNIVIKSFINRTNARSLFSRMEEEGHPAVLVQNNEQMFRIIIESCRYEVDALKLLEKVKVTWPDAWILVRY